MRDVNKCKPISNITEMLELNLITIYYIKVVDKKSESNRETEVYTLFFAHTHISISSLKSTITRSVRNITASHVKRLAS